MPLRGILGPLGVGRGVAAAWSPLSLSPWLWVKANVASALYEDSSMTTLASLSGVVGAIADKSGNNNHIKQAGATSLKPIYFATGVWAMIWLRYHKAILLLLLFLLSACREMPPAQNALPALKESPTSAVNSATTMRELPVVILDTAIYKEPRKASAIVRNVFADSPVSGDGCVTTFGYSEEIQWFEGVFLMTDDGYLLVRDWMRRYVTGVCE